MLLGLFFIAVGMSIDFGVLQEVTYYLLETGKKLNINPLDWGFASEELAEVSF